MSYTEKVRLAVRHYQVSHVVGAETVLLRDVVVI